MTHDHVRQLLVLLDSHAELGEKKGNKNDNDDAAAVDAMWKKIDHIRRVFVQVVTKFRFTLPAQDRKQGLAID
jgi:hypothetical protein